jgi:hypothetical protein
MYGYTIREAPELQSAHNAAFVGAVFTYLQDAPIDHAHFYRGDAAWMSLFDLNGYYYNRLTSSRRWAKCSTHPRVSAL